MNWYEIIKQKEYLYVIREKLDRIEPRFLTKYINMFLLLGHHIALLIDTGSGLFPLKPVIDKLIGERKLMVFNTHSHFDHRGSNSEFEKIYIHENEINEISIPFDVSFLKESPNQLVKLYQEKNFKLPAANNIQPLKDGAEFNLDGIQIKVIHTPGHSNGSICLLTNKGELFTGDTAHYGSMYLPIKEEFPIILNSLHKLIQQFATNDNLQLYPSHEEYAIDKDLLIKLHDGIQNIENIWETRVHDDFLECFILKDEIFRYVIQKNY
ncbi:MAG: MBL fold metallo-hydrolase [Candidatus Hermodarchaeota archaeon]